MYRDCFSHLPTIERRRIQPNAPTDVRLHRGEKVEPWLPSVQLAARGWPVGTVEWYASYPEFIEKLAKFVGVPQDRIVIGAGIEEFIRTLTFLCCDPGDYVASTWPSCAMYDLYPRIFGARHVRVQTPLHETWDANAVISQLPRSNAGKLFFLVNPSQPIEVCLDLGELRKVADFCQNMNMLLAIDEAYHGFGAPTALPLVDEFDNILIMRTFSKAFGAASIRVGYAIGHPRVIKPLDAARPSGEISGPSMHIASTLLDLYDSHVLPGISDVIDGRDWLRRKLTADGFKTWGKLSNFVLVDLDNEYNVSQLAAELRRHGFFVRHSNPKPFDRHMMITCGSVELMRKFYDAFSEIVDRARRVA